MFALKHSPWVFLFTDYLAEMLLTQIIQRFSKYDTTVFYRLHEIYFNFIIKNKIS